MPRDEHQTRIELINPVLHEREWTDAYIREARAEDKLPSLGIQQAKNYMKKFNLTMSY